MWSKERLANLAALPDVGKPYVPFTDTQTYKRPYETYDTVEQRPYVLVFSRPPGMNVLLNDVPAGMTPLLRPLPNGAAQMKVRIEGTGFESVEQVVQPDKLGHIRLGVDMKPVPRD